MLCNFFIKRYSREFKKDIRGISNKALTKLTSYYYPGNVRELENLMERAVMLTQGKVILVDTLGEVKAEKNPVSLPLPIVSQDFTESRDYILSTFEKQFILEKLTSFKGNISKAAKASNMSRQNFHRLMDKYGRKDTSIEQKLTFCIGLNYL